MVQFCVPGGRARAVAAADNYSRDVCPAEGSKSHDTDPDVDRNDPD